MTRSKAVQFRPAPTLREVPDEGNNRQWKETAARYANDGWKGMAPDKRRGAQRIRRNPIALPLHRKEATRDLQRLEGRAMSRVEPHIRLDCIMEQGPWTTIIARCRVCATEISRYRFNCETVTNLDEVGARAEADARKAVTHACPTRA
jgi:hypothetical protein